MESVESAALASLSASAESGYEAALWRRLVCVAAKHVPPDETPSAPGIAWRALCAVLRAYDGRLDEVGHSTWQSWAWRWGPRKVRVLAERSWREWDGLELSEDLDEEPSPWGEPVDPDETAGALLRAVERLPPAQREAVRALAERGGRAGLAERAGVSQQAIGTRLERAVARLRADAGVQALAARRGLAAVEVASEPMCEPTDQLVQGSGLRRHASTEWWRWTDPGIPEWPPVPWKPKPSWRRQPRGETAAARRKRERGMIYRDPIPSPSE